MFPEPGYSNQADCTHATNIQHGVIALDSLNPKLLDAFSALPQNLAVHSATLPDAAARDLLETLDGREGEINGVTVFLFALNGAFYALVLDSPHTGYYAFCAPCLPDAGDLNAPNLTGPLTYDVPPDWRKTEFN